MNPQDGFLQDIIEHPDDDAPRLIFADWLEEHGEPARAEFIRIQIRLAQSPEYDPFFQEIQHNRRELISGDSFRNRVALPLGITWAWETFRRGFVWGVEARSIPAYLERAEQLFTLAPIQHLEVDGRNGSAVRDLPLLTDSPWLGRLRSLDIKLGDLGSDSIRRLCESPHAQGLRRLAFRFGGINQAGVAALVSSSLFSQLLELDLSHTDYASPVGPTFATYVRGVRTPCQLQKLCLASTRFGPDDARQLAEASALRSLIDLDLSICSYDRMLHGDGLRVLAESPNLTQLRILRLAKTEPQLGGIRALRESKWTSLRYLDLQFNRLGPKAGQMLANADVLKNLTVLLLRGNPAGTDTALAIARSPFLNQLAVLGLDDTKIRQEGAEALLHSPNLANIVRLEMRNDKSLTSDLLQAFQERFGKRAAVR